MIINAENLVLGRLSSLAAKKALAGEKVDIINSEKSIVIGTKSNILKKYHRKRKMGRPHVGPFFPRRPDLIVKRTIRGMLPYKQEKGKKAFKNIKCYMNIPSSFKDKKTETFSSAKLSPNILKFITLKELSKELGWQVK